MTWSDERIDDLSQKVDENNQRIGDLDREMHAEFHAVRGEMKEEFRAIRAEMKEEGESRRSEIQDMRSAMDRRFDGMQASITTFAVTIFATTTSGFIALLAAMILTR